MKHFSLPVCLISVAVKAPYTNLLLETGLMRAVRSNHTVNLQAIKCKTKTTTKLNPKLLRAAGMGEYTSMSHFTWGHEVDCGVRNLAKRSLKKSSGFLKTIDVMLHHQFTVFFYLKICFQYVPVYLCSERD